MKKILLLAVAIVMCAGLASAQSGGHIGIYSDSPGYADCNLVETLFVADLNIVYVVHSTAAEGNTSQFMVAKTWGALDGAISYGTNLNLGEFFTGVTITYVGCKPLPHLLGTIKAIPVAATPACTIAYEVVPDPILPSGQIEVIDCSNNLLFATGGKLTVNGDQSCPCVIATEESSWSKIKALYQ